MLKMTSMVIVGAGLYSLGLPPQTPSADRAHIQSLALVEETDLVRTVSETRLGSLRCRRLSIHPGPGYVPRDPNPHFTPHCSGGHSGAFPRETDRPLPAPRIELGS